MKSNNDSGTTADSTRPQRMLAVLICFSALILSSCATDSFSPNVVETNQGLARGVEVEGTVSFLGIKYARADRWRLPEDGPAWSGVRTFDEFGHSCPQEGQEVMDEDCLFLNVFTPDGASAGDRLPVLIWIHGGGFKMGRGGDSPSAFVNNGIVVVTFNYRLGVLGFHDWQGWSNTDPRNFGQADMVKALEWVNRNIQAFGGDPGNVTLAGHSAGGMGVQLMMVDPRARGLFQRAISDAGYGTWPFLQAGNRSPETRALSDLEYDVTPEELVARTPYFHLPYIGGADLPRQPIEIFESGDQAPVPFMTGANSYDGYRILEGAGYQADEFIERYRAAPGVATEYASDFAVADEQAAARLFGDMRYVHAAWSTARAMQSVGQPGYLFYYDEPMNDLPGTPHGGHYRDLHSTEAVPLKDYMVSFVTTGNPNGKGLPQWMGYTNDSPVWMKLDPGPTPVRGLMTQRMAIIEDLDFPRPDRND